MRRFALMALAMLLFAPAKALAQADTVLMLAGTGLARGGNSLVYARISTKRVTVQPGDVLEYDLFIAPHSSEISGGPDLEFDSGEPFRDSGVRDRNGENIHPNHVLLRARGQWYHREIPLDIQAGKTTTRWTLVLEGDTPGPYAVFADNIAVRRADGSRTEIYTDGPAPSPIILDGIAGYSQNVVLRAVDRAKVQPGADIKALVEKEIAEFEAYEQVRRFQRDIQLAADMIAQTPGGDSYEKYIQAARRVADSVQSGPPLSDEAMHARLREGRDVLARVRPLMKRYTGHLVGHAHIDFQWQWEWPETLDVADKTFSQAIRFMDEFPGFAFSQSNTALYRAVEEHYPALFKKIQEKVKKGQWEIVGGRVSEGDTNIISEESHARQFLLGQRYFREHFDKTVTVGWEPDTFGHTWSLPQILKMGGIDSYYFGRGGHDKPLFWWEGPDGTRVLAFDEIASGSWYDSNLEPKILDELPPWHEKTGVNDIMWVYGVGNHGGGPTREQLETARTWMKTPYYPEVKFSRAEEFFTAARKEVPESLPVVKDELDPRIAGVFTTHAEMKRMNRDAENTVASAEVAATIASLYGRPYPRERFNEFWYDIAFNHHHDTVPGSATHDAYANNHLQLPAITAEALTIGDASARYIAQRVTRPQGAEYAVMAFNPLGWARDGEVRFPWPYITDNRGWIAVSPSGHSTPVTLMRGPSEENPSGEPMAAFTATAVPGFGYSVYVVRPEKDGERPAGRVQMRREGDRYILENGRLRVAVRSDNGLITSLFDLARNRETVAEGGSANRLEIWQESPGPNDAWQVREYTGHERLDGPAEVKVVEDTPGRVTLEITRQYRRSSVTQWIRLRAGADQMDLPIFADWREEGQGDASNPFLKVASDVAGRNLAADYEIPFATIRRPMDGKEVVALRSASLTGPDGGLALINDSRHGHSAEGSTLRLSLVRTPNRLDPTSDVRTHFVNTSLVPSAANRPSDRVRRGYEWNQPMLAVRVPPAAMGELPVEKSFLTITGDTVVPTILKRAEDDPNAIVVRFYEAGGAPARVGAQPDAAFGVNGSRWVNFIEDPLSGIQAGPSARADLRPYEICNVLFLGRKP